jgi:hypothetical protein
VEVADHVHVPAGLGDGEHERRVRIADQHPRRPLLADDRTRNRHGDFDCPGGGIGDRGRRCGQTIALDADLRRTAGMGDPHQLQRCVRRPGEQLRRLRGDDVHAKNTTAFAVRLDGLETVSTADDEIFDVGELLVDRAERGSSLCAKVS